MHFHRYRPVISLRNGITFIRGGGVEFSRGGKWPIVSMEGRILALFEGPWWTRGFTIYIYIYTFSPSREEGRRRDFTSVRSSKHRRPSSSRSRRRTKDDWTGGQDALCGYECFFSEGIFLREKKISTIFSSFLSFYRGIIFHNLQGNFRNDGSIFLFISRVGYALFDINVVFPPPFPPSSFYNPISRCINY